MQKNILFRAFSFYDHTFPSKLRFYSSNQRKCINNQHLYNISYLLIAEERLKITDEQNSFRADPPHFKFLFVTAAACLRLFSDYPENLSLPFKPIRSSNWKGWSCYTWLQWNDNPFILLKKLLVTIIATALSLICNNKTDIKVSILNCWVNRIVAFCQVKLCKNGGQENFIFKRWFWLPGLNVG